MEVKGYEINLKNLLAETDGNAPGPAYAQHTVKYSNAVSLVSSELTERLAVTELYAKEGGYMFAAKDIKTLKKGLSISKAMISGIGSFALVSGTYGNGTFQKSAYTKKTSGVKFIDRAIIDYRFERMKQRGAYVFVLSVDGGKNKASFSGDADVRFIGSVGKLPVSQIAFALNGFKDVFVVGSPFKKLSWRERRHLAKFEKDYGIDIN